VPLSSHQVGYLNRLTDMVRGQLTAIERSKLVALITMEIHNRDVMDRMIKANCASIQDFEWLSQCRFVFFKDQGQWGMCSVKQTNSTLEYSYEYQGNNGRLVVSQTCRLYFEDNPLGLQPDFMPFLNLRVSARALMPLHLPSADYQSPALRWGGFSAGDTADGPLRADADNGHVPQPRRQPPGPRRHGQDRDGRGLQRRHQHDVSGRSIIINIINITIIITTIIICFLPGPDPRV
jgi:hypothetical protein